MRQIFVFGSNEAGRHGRGSALEAVRNHGAIYGVGEGIQGNAYGIPTKDTQLRILPLNKINEAVKRFILFAIDNQNCEFNVVAIGCGLAGYKPNQIAPMFHPALHLRNVRLPREFWECL